MRLVLLLALAAAACAPPPPAQVPASAAPSASPTAVPTPAASPSPPPSSFSKLRVFVASDMTDTIYVLEGGAEFAVTTKIPVGKMPHNIAVSPDARWVAVANRMANSVTILDPVRLVEVARVGVGRQPHDLIWQPDGAVLFVGHERDPFIARISVEGWRPLAPLVVGVPQHDLAIGSTRPDELYFTVTNSSELDHLRVYGLATSAITRIKVEDVHDVFFTPDEREVWSASSGFLNVRSDRLVVYDPALKTVKEEVRFPGRYPFHTMKVHRDGAFFPPAGTPMLLSDHGGPALLYVDVAHRTIEGETRLGPRPFHTTYDPIGDRLLVTSSGDGAVRVIDLLTRAVVQKIHVPAAHGIVAIGLP